MGRADRDEASPTLPKQAVDRFQLNLILAYVCTWLQSRIARIWMSYRAIHKAPLLEAASCSNLDSYQGAAPSHTAT